MTLIELLCAIAIIAILAGLTIPPTAKALKRAKHKIEDIEVWHAYKTYMVLDDKTSEKTLVAILSTNGFGYDWRLIYTNDHLIMWTK